MGDDEVEEHFSVSSHSELEVEEEVHHSLWLNGFCVLSLGLEGKLEDAIREVTDLHEVERFQPPPSQVVDSLLGDNASNELAWLAEGKEEAEGETLQALKQDLRWLAGCTFRYSSEAFGLEGMKASPLAVVQGGVRDPDDEREPTSLDINSCDFWMSLLFPAKLQMVYFLGPEYGKLELDPFDEESEPIIVETQPDMIVIFRCDALQCRLTASNKDHMLCSWIASPNSSGPRGWNTFNEDEIAKNPTNRELGKWAVDRLEELMRQDVAGELPEETPVRWQRWMRATYFRHSYIPTAIVGTATHSPGTHNNDIFFKTLVNGVDYSIEVPFMRWRHEEYYDPDPNCWIHSHVATGGITKTSVKHHTFIDGVELFDNKFFQISQSEATGMEPQQKHILETSYEALAQAGYTKKMLMNSYIAVFSGSTNPEAAYIPYPTGAGAGNVSQAITSNRTSFVFGCMGPSTSIDCEMASSAMAIQLGCAATAPNNNWRQKTGGHSDASITGGVYINVAGAFMWPRFHMHMNPAGRSLTFDQSANGYVRGEACTSVIQKPYTEKVDDEWVVTGDNILSTIVGYRMTSNGKAASLTAPSVPAMQEAVDGAVRDASLSPLDIDAVECNGTGGALDDAVEVLALARVLRYGPEAQDEPLALGAVKTNAAAQCEAAAMSSFIKVLFSIVYAVNVGGLHLKTLNPHFEPGEALLFNTETLPYRDEWGFHGDSARGWGGINTHMIQWYKVAENLVRTEKLETERQPMTFWPGGGGHLEAETKPIDAYFIVGSFNNWKPEIMEPTEEGHWKFVVTMGMNRFETFQLWLDGDSNKVLHPGQPRAPSACSVQGPIHLDAAHGLNWLIDGREIPATSQFPGYSTRDKGRVGDQFEVLLNIAGKYRAVSWKKVKEGAEENVVSDVDGTYYVTGNFNNWGLDEMTPSPEASLGLHTLRLGPLKAEKNEFQIIRNKAFDQRFHPPFATMFSEMWDEYEVEGPDDAGHGKNWCLKGKIGDYFTVEFQRVLGGGTDVKRICWRKET